MSEVVSMPFPKSAQSKGGRALATPSQKAAARQWILENKPWLKSTGATTPEGRLASSLNSQKASYKRILTRKQGKNDEFEAEIEREKAFLNRLNTRIGIFLAGKNCGSERTKTVSRLGGKAVIRFWFAIDNLSSDNWDQLCKIIDELKARHYQESKLK